jgi:hypothetical protein
MEKDQYRIAIIVFSEGRPLHNITVRIISEDESEVISGVTIRNGLIEAVCHSIGKYNVEIIKNGIILYKCSIDINPTGTIHNIEIGKHHGYIHN